MRLAVFHHQRALQRAARTLAGLERIRLARLELVVITAAIENKSQVAHDHTGAESAVQTRRESNQVARRINHSNVTGIAIVIAFAGDGYFHRAIERRFILGELLSRTGTKLERGRVLVDHGATLGSVFPGQQTLVGDLDEVQIAEILVAIGESELGGFDAGVDVIGAVVAQSLQVITLENAEREQLCRA